MNLVKIKVSPSMIIVVVGELHNSMVVKEQLVERGIYTLLSILFASLLHHSGLAHTSRSLNHYESVAPYDSIV